MRVYKKSGTKERLFEMFENVNKVKLNESNQDVNLFMDFINNNEEELYMKYKNYVQSLPDDQNQKNNLLRKSQYFEEWVEENFYNKATNTFDLNNYVEESFDSPIEKDKKYLDKTQGDQDSQVSKYDDGTRYPVEKELKVSDPSLEGLKGDDAPLDEEENIDEISWSGVKGAAKKVGGDISKGVSNAVNSVGNSINNYADGVVKTYHKGARNKIVGDLEKMADKFGNEFGDMVAKINDRARKAGDEEINLRSLTQTIANAIFNRAKNGGGNMSLSNFRKEGLREDDEEIEKPEMGSEEEHPLAGIMDMKVDDQEGDTDNIAMDMGHEDSLEGGLADDAMPSEFDPEQVIKGIKVEMEHTNDPKIAIEIVMDHLTEIPDYYDHLDDMEAEASEEHSEEDCGCDDCEDCNDNPEDSLLDPSKHWVDDYSAKNIAGEKKNPNENINYPSPLADPEAGEEEHEEMDKLSRGEYDEENPENEEGINESKYEVHYSDGIRQKKDFNNPDEGVAFMKSTIKSNPKLQNIAMFDASRGFHSTADVNNLVYWWGDGSYFDNVAQKNPELNKKKLVKTNLDIEEGINKSNWTNTKNDPLPDDINIPIASMENFKEDLLGRGVPSVTSGDEANILSRPDQIDNWKEGFIRMHGENGNLVKDDFFKKYFKVVGNESHANAMGNSNKAKGDTLNKERASGDYKMFDSYEPAMNEDSSTDVEIYDELEMRYSPTMKRIPHNDISDVAQMYDMDDEDVAQIAAQVIADNQNSGYEEITDDVKDLIRRFEENNIDYHNQSVKDIWQVFEKEYEASSELSEFEPIWNKLTKDPNQTNMFESNRMENIQYNYDQKGNFIPKGYEDKRIALRALEQPMGSGNWKVAIVTLDMNGEMDKIQVVKDNWGDAKEEILKFL